MAGSCGAFCSFCGKCGRRASTVFKTVEVPQVAPPGVAVERNWEAEAEGAEAEDADAALGSGSGSDPDAGSDAPVKNDLRGRKSTRSSLAGSPD